MAIAVGDTAPEVSHTLTRTDLVRYAGASGDFNPMHHDEVKATKAGMPSVFGHGMLSMAILGRALTDWLGAGALQSYRVRFVKQTWPGNTVSTRITVTDAREADGDRVVELDCELVNDDGDTVVAGSAVATVGGSR